MHPLAGVLAVALLATTAAQAEANYDRDVKPILQASCYPCHSGTQPQAQLRLDAKAPALKGGLSGPVIVPGDSARSRLIQRVLGANSQPRMPLGGKPLTSEQIGLLRGWIDQGARWPDPSTPEDARIAKHWAYVKPVRPLLPALRHDGWVRNPIDSFVLARLEKEGLEPSPEAPREKLIRRLSLDLIGLPPTPAEVDEFLNDRRPDAYQRLVDRLLSSPHYGERWARPWLDLARYADTNGWEKDRRRTMWKYRDWVIHALNRDLPFDRFTVEQLAGDLLAGATVDQKVATGFHRNTLFNEEGGVDNDEAHWEVLVDRVNTTATVWLGSTLGCAQCHNHKYDPFTQKEFYQFLAFFNNSDYRVAPNGDSTRINIEPRLELPTPEQQKRRDEINREIEALEGKLKAETPELAAEQQAWEARLRARALDASWKPLATVTAHSASGSTLTSRADGSLAASGSNPSTDTYVIEARLPKGVKPVTALRLEALPEASLPRGGPGRDTYGNFVLSDMRLEWLGGWRAKPRPLAVKLARADDGRIRRSGSDALWTIDASKEEKRNPRQLVLVLDKPTKLGRGRLRVTLIHASEYSGQGLGCFRLSATQASAPEAAVEVPARLRAALGRPEQRKQLSEAFRRVAVSLKQDRDRLEALRKELDGLGIETALIMGDRLGTARLSAPVRIRGSYLNPGETVYAATPAALNLFPVGEPVNRLGLGRWLVSPDNPLTARVIVNRIWEQYFGRGLVETSEDFGSQGQRPSHPELLDWLAVEFMEKGWSQKTLHRLIVTSATYRQDSRTSAPLQERDPYNRLLARGPRFRMEAEMIRDVTLSASGLLNPKIGGPSVFPFQPEGIWDIPYNDDKWKISEGADRYRRGLYTFVRRTSPYPSMATFDGPSREVCTVRRPRTNTPLQALTTLNDPAFFEAAQALGRRVTAEAGPTPEARAAYVFRLCTSRKPGSTELAAILRGYQQDLAEFRKNPTQAAKLSGSSGADAAERAAWTMVANTLLNLDETLTKE